MAQTLIRLALAPSAFAAGLAADALLGRPDDSEYVSRTAPSGPPPGCDDRWDFERGTWKRGCQ